MHGIFALSSLDLHKSPEGFGAFIVGKKIFSPVLVGRQNNSLALNPLK
jgi:hypothetical protein